MEVVLTGGTTLAKIAFILLFDLFPNVVWIHAFKSVCQRKILMYLLCVKENDYEDAVNEKGVPIAF